MKEIKCPKCGEVFVVDGSGYAQIVQQVRDKEFAEELKRRENEFEEKKENALKIAKAEQKEKFDKALSSKESEILERESYWAIGSANFPKRNRERACDK